MTLDFKKAIISSLNYSINIRKLPYYFLFQIFALILIFYPLLSLIEITYSNGLFDNSTPDPQVVDTIIESFGYFFLSIVLVLIISSVLTPTFIYNYTQYRQKKEDSLKSSLKYAMPYVLTVFGAFITLAFLTNIIGGIISMISPLLGRIVSFILSLIFIFVIQDIIIKKSSISKSLVSSYTYVSKNLFEVLLLYITTVAFSIFLMLIFAIPLISVVSNSIAPVFEMLTVGAPSDGVLASGVSYSTVITTIASAIKSDIELYLVSITTLLLGCSISRLFSIAFITDIYLQLSKK